MESIIVVGSWFKILGVCFTKIMFNNVDTSSLEKSNSLLISYHKCWERIWRAIGGQIWRWCIHPCLGRWSIYGTAPVWRVPYQNVQRHDLLMDSWNDITLLRVVRRVNLDTFKEQASNTTRGNIGKLTKIWSLI